MYMMATAHPSYSLKDSAVARLLVEGRLPDNYPLTHRLPLDLSSPHPSNGLDQDYRSDSGEPEPALSPGDSWHPSIGTPETSPSPPMQAPSPSMDMGNPVYACTSRDAVPDSPKRGAHRRKRRPQQRIAPSSPPMPILDPEDGSSSPSSSPPLWRCQYCPFSAKDKVTLYSHYQFHQQLLAGSSDAARSHMEWITTYQRDRFYDQKTLEKIVQPPGQSQSLEGDSMFLPGPHFRSIPRGMSGHGQGASTRSPDPPCSGSPALRHLLQSHTLDVSPGCPGKSSHGKKATGNPPQEGSASGFLRSIVQNIMQQGNGGSQTNPSGRSSDSAAGDTIYSNLLKNVADSQPWEAANHSADSTPHVPGFPGEQETYRRGLFAGQKDRSPPAPNMSASRHLESLLKARTSTRPPPIEIKPEPEDIGYVNIRSPQVLVVQPEDDSLDHSSASSDQQDTIKQQLKMLLTRKRHSPPDSSESSEPAMMTSATTETWTSLGSLTPLSAPSPSKRPVPAQVDYLQSDLQQSSSIGLQCALCECAPHAQTPPGDCPQQQNIGFDDDDDTVLKVATSAGSNTTKQFSGKTPDGGTVVSVSRTRCNFCDINFGDAVLHSIHMGCHSAVDPFQCNVCSKPCSDKYAFYAHIMRGHQAV